jgi:membrane-associated phospholipid phosphatase
VNALVLAYLVVSTVPLALAVALDRTSAVRLAVHVGFVLLTAWGTRRPNALTQWIPLLLVPALYTELPHVAAGLSHAMHDARVIGWELALFGESPARTFAARASWPWLSETLHAGYLSYYALIYGPPLLLFATGRRRAFGEATFALMLAFVCCYAVFACFPVQGPWFEWPAPAAIPRGPVRLAVERLLHAGSSRGTAFPSSHVAVSLTQSLVMLRLARPVGVACAVCTLALALGAVYGGLHYGIDVLVGAALGTLIGLLGPGLYRRLT